MRWLSEITPAVAALMGAGIALVGALLSQLISHRFTAQRERQGEIRSRQYDAIIRAAQALEKPEDVSGMLKQVEVEESLEQRQARVSVARAAVYSREILRARLLLELNSDQRTSS